MSQQEEINHAVSEAKRRCPDYPWKDNTASEAVWALGTALEGTRLANDDLHTELSQLRAELAEALKYGAPEDGGLVIGGVKPQCTKHNTYWTTMSGACMACRAETAEKELAGARAVIAKLPKTADGVPVVPGMTLWEIGTFGDVREARWNVGMNNTDILERFVSLYSTRSSAEQAVRG